MLLTVIMGLAIFLSLPIILRKSLGSRTITFLNAVAIGILVFLLADIFSDAAPMLSTSAAYLTVPILDVLFVVSVVGIYLVLYVIDQHPPAPDEATRPMAAERPSAPVANPVRLAAIIAIGIGLQNLTEGLVFGSAWTQGEIELVAVVFVGFVLQNVTEGFPIVSPFLGERTRNVTLIVGLFLIGGVPTILGGVVGYFYTNATLALVFDALAIGAILYVIVPMLKGAFRTGETRMETYRKQRLVYLGLLVGFVLGFVVNAL